MISVIIPIYNVEEYLDRCIESIINQTFKNLEIILVNDGSTDNCLDICKKWLKIDKRIKLIDKKNGGLSDARNAGMKIAQGEYISFIDSDDSISKDFYEIMYTILLKNNSDIVECNIIDVYDNIKPKDNNLSDFVEKNYTSFEAIKELVKNNDFHQTVWNKLYKKSVISNINFPYRKLHEDEFFTWKVFKNCTKLTKINCSLYHYYHRKGSIMETNYSLNRLDALDARLERYVDLKLLYPSLEKELKISIVFPCIFSMQKVLNMEDKQSVMIGKRKIEKIYNAAKLNRLEMKQLSLKLKIWLYLSNYSVTLCAKIRNFLNKPS